MSAGNLKLAANSAYSVVHVTMDQIAEWWGQGRLRPTLWQRAPRWNARRDTDQWITCVLQNTPVVPIFVHQTERDDGSGYDYLIIDGQNRSKACYSFLREGTTKVRAGDVLRFAAAPDDMLTFNDFSPEQRERIATNLIPMCVFNPTTTEGELRRVFRNLNRGKMLSSYEIIRSWDHVPMVRDVLNPLDERLCARILAISPRWKPQNHRMLHTYIRIAAMMYSDWLHLQSADRIEQWVACRGARPRLRTRTRRRRTRRTRRRTRRRTMSTMTTRAGCRQRQRPRSTHCSNRLEAKREPWTDRALCKLRVRSHNSLHRRGRALIQLLNKVHRIVKVPPHQAIPIET